MAFRLKKIIKAFSYFKFNSRELPLYFAHLAFNVASNYILSWQILLEIKPDTAWWARKYISAVFSYVTFLETLILLRIVILSNLKTAWASLVTSSNTNQVSLFYSIKESSCTLTQMYFCNVSSDQSQTSPDKQFTTINRWC